MLFLIFHFPGVFLVIVRVKGGGVNFYIFFSSPTISSALFSILLIFNNNLPAAAIKYLELNKFYSPILTNIGSLPVITFSIIYSPIFFNKLLHENFLNKKEIGEINKSIFRRKGNTKGNHSGSIKKDGHSRVA